MRILLIAVAISMIIVHFTLKVFDGSIYPYENKEISEPVGSNKGHIRKEKQIH